MADRIEQLFARHGEESVVGGNTPFLLGDPTCVWFVASGRVEVFSVSASERRRSGARRHFFTVEQGAVLFGFDAVSFGWGRSLLAVGVMGTRVQRMEAALLRSLLDSEEGRADLARALDGWVSGLSEGVTREIVPRPRADRLAEAGQEFDVPAGQRLRSRASVLWANQRGGSLLFIGMEELSLADEQALVPFGVEAWLQPTADTRLRLRDTSAVLSEGCDWRSALDTYYDIVFRCEVANIGLRAVDELNRLQDRAQIDARAQRTGVVSLASVLESTVPGAVRADTSDLLLAACQLVGDRLGIVVRAPVRQDEAIGVDPLREIARASSFRVRGVVLKGEWWTQDNGPLLGALEEDKRPVAILPKAGGGYEVHDPRTGERIVVTADIAEQLSAKGHMFYRSFPNTKLGPWALFEFGIARKRKGLVLLVATGLAGGLLGLVPPYFTGFLVDTVIPEAGRSQLIQLSLILVVMSIATSLFQLVRALATLKVEMDLSTAVQPALWDRLLRLPVTFFRRYTAGDLAQRVGGIDFMRQILSGAVTSTLLGAVFSLFQLGFLLYYSWKLALLGLGLVLVVILAVVGTGLLRVRIQRDVAKTEGKVSGFVLQLLTGAAKLRVTGGESRAFAEWARQFGEQRRLAYRAGLVDRTLQVFTAVFPVLCSMALFWAVLSPTFAPGEGESFSVGDFVAFNAAFGTFLMSMLQMANAAMSTLIIVPIYERARPILTEPLEADERKVDPGELNGSIEVSHVFFRYREDGPLILNDVSIQTRPGEFVAIVGPSGSGKSTLLRMMLGLEQPVSGSVFYDGIDLATIDTQKLRRRIGVVMQGGQVRAGSILANVIGSTLLTQDDAWEAAKMAGLADDVRAMPMGMHTVVPHGGTTLSGGQRQRLIIARAIVARPRVIFFDEATSALDNRTQAVVAESLRQLQATRVVIAHRLSTIVGADRIYVMQGGRVVQAGSYEELLAQPGLFADLMRRQVA